ncbi:BEACH domain-containing protein B [Lycium barbarum]|uniref:BEACH domain-containing protein B n=1 Tax=Lycium barbarum TaxID=112863 RepID=UPI00293E6CFC|nr:BEACH domain-containing protein B [Lycium barbarum]XP_060199083.1 BEACH domain-containing protein B [Lycium barbarum]
MNIVKGVAGLIRRSSGSHGGESSSGSPLERFSPPTPLIHFSEVGDEAILNTLWSRYEKAPDKVEKRRLFHIFLKQFLIVYRDWQPISPLQSAEDHASVQPVDSQHFGDVVVGCSFGHPTEIIVILVEEVAQMIALVNEHLSRNSSTITSEGLPVLDALTVITRSMHNCRVLGYYGGIQKLTALKKAAVVQLKAIASALSADEALTNSVPEKTAILQNILLYVVSIIGSFINLHFSTSGKAWFNSGHMEIFGPRSVETRDVVTGVDVSDSETMIRWRQKAIVSVMEAGGLNWLVELLRVMKRLNMKEQDTDISLHYLTLRALQLALVENPRGQNHFRSIGGLEVLLDGLGVASNSALRLRDVSTSDTARNANVLAFMFQLHVLSLEVLREAVFGNLNNLQFLSENGRVQKFANSFCSLAFMLQEYKEKSDNLVAQDDMEITVSSDKDTTAREVLGTKLSNLPSIPYLKNWHDYVAKLSAVLFSFLLSPEDANSDKSQASTVKSSLPVSSAYGELSVKWIIRVLLTVFPCIKACSNQKELPGHLRTFIYTLQHHVLSAFRKILVLLPSLLHVFRAEGAWDFIFSENFFYFGLASLGSSDDSLSKKGSSDDCTEHCCDSNDRSTSLSIHELEALQTEVVSFLEFAATLTGSSHNLPECSILLEALEQSACNPWVANLLAKSLLQIMRSSSEKTLSSFKTLDAVLRVLKVACVQAQESKRHGIASPHTESGPVPSLNQDMVNSLEMIHSWQNSMETFIELVAEYFSLTKDAKSSTLHSATCVDRLFDLFWEEKLRNRMLPLILDLMKIVPSSEEDQKAKLYICSKYLETFTHVKDRENFVELSIDLLVGMIDLLLTDIEYYQALFRDGECFIHVVSLLNGNLDVPKGEELVLNVLQTLTCLLSGNDVSKAAFRDLVGTGYQTLRSLLLDFCQWKPSEALLDALLDMLVDGKFDLKASPMIKNEDVILLYLSVLQKSSDSLRNQGLDVFLQLIRDSMSNQASCVKAGMLNFLLDWFPQEGKDTVVLKIAQLIQVVGGHSISGKDIRKIFALLRSEKVGSHQQYSSLLLTSMLSMLNEKGPTAFFDLSGVESGILIKTPVQWPLNKGFSFTCWLRVESFPRGGGTMGLFSFLTESGRGCIGVLGKDKLIYESINQKRQSVVLQVNLVRKKWHFLCLTHTIGRTFSGGSQLKCYLDGTLVSSEKCRYAKVNEPLTCCTIGTKISLPSYEEESPALYSKDPSAFYGQIGPVYLFNDSIASEHVLGIYSLGPSYMYSFLDNETAVHLDSPLPSGVLDVKDGLASKIIFGLNSQARNGRRLFNVSPVVDPGLDKSSFEATVLVGTQLCSRRLLQQIIYCVGGVSVFFPLFTKTDLYEIEEAKQAGQALLTPITKERLTAEVIELIASVLDENLANQQQMLLLAGFPILGFLLQSVPPEQLNMDTLSALKHLFNVVANGGLSETLVKDAISHIFLSPVIWVYSGYRVQRELYMFLIQQFDNDPRLLRSLCRLPRVLDIIRQFYWDDVKTRSAIGSKPLLHPVTKQVIGERPSKDEIHKIRLLLLSLGEMSLRQHISASDIKSLIAFFESSQDMACIEDVLHMVIRAVSQKQLLASFLEQVNLIGGCHIFVNLLERDFEPIRLLGLQFLGRLLVGLPLEKKGSKFFSIAVGRSKSLSEGLRKIGSRTQPIFSVISDRLFKFPQTDLLCATLYDVLLGGASPKQVLQKHSQLDRQKSSRNSSQFFLPQILALIFRFLSGCKDAPTRIKIISDLLDLLDSTATNIEALMENGWNAWLDASVKLNALKNYKLESKINDDTETSEQNHLRSFYCVVLCHYMHSIKGGWQHLEETVNFLLVQFEQGGIAYRYFLRDLYEDLVRKLLDLSAVENVLVTQPCRDNMLYLLKLVDEMLLSEMKFNLPYPASNTEFSSEFLELEQLKDLGSALLDALQGEPDEKLSRSHVFKRPDINEVEKIDDEWWTLCDNLWNAISEMNGKGPNKMLPRSSQSVAPSLSQRARGLVESLNIPAAEMAAVVVSGGISNALAGKPNKPVDKAMLLRGEKCPRIVFRLIILYLCKSSLERASRCVQQVIPLLPCLLTADDEQSKSRLQLFIWALLAVRSHYGALDDGARFHVIAHIIRETVNCGKLMLATSIVSRDDSSESGSNTKEGSTIHNLIQKDRVLSAFADEVKYVKSSTADRTMQLHELRARLDEMAIADSNQKKSFEDEIQSSLNVILASDDNRRSSFQLAYDEQQQIVAGKWIHTFRSLIDERGPWSADPFPNSTLTHWKLDKTEDAWRRRQKLRRDYHFDEKLCRPTSTTPSIEALNPSNDAKPGFAAHIPEQMKRFLLKGIRRITDEGSSELNESESELSGQKPGSDDLSDRQYLEVVKESSDLKDIAKEDIDCSSTQIESEDSEVLMSVPCVLVTPKRKLAGHLAVKKKFLHFFGEFLVEGTGGSSVFRNFDSSGKFDVNKSDQLGGLQNHKFLKWPISYDLDCERGRAINSIGAVNNDEHQKHPNNINRHRRWTIFKVKAVHWTRYLLRYTAIEIFFSDSTAPVFFNFASQKDAKDVGSLIVLNRNESMFPKGYRDKTGVISFVDRRVALEMAENARERWKRREITNFEYLMVLNTLAGRSYNDLTQYPVFPWILADYSSETLDFNKSSTFRDLSKPVGALDAKRFEVFEDRYRNFCDPDIPSFYYGSHYSSMGIVLFYLLRLEPFTGLHRNLQGGKFDHADRLFHSIGGTYRNCLSNTSDVKELIPEFFYLPEFLINSNSYYFGVKQDGEPIGDICLPPWAKGCPEEFISKNREALESEYVSSNLHHWIDLVFGYKQRGKPAVEAANIFYYLTYEGAVDLDTMDDELQRSAIEDQIANFGQTPIQLFRKKHPRRGPPIPIAHPLRFAPGSINLTSMASCSSSCPSTTLYVNVLDSTIVLVNQGLTMSVKTWVTTQLQSGGNFTFSGSQDPFFGIGSDILPPRKIGSPLAENIELGAQCFGTLSTPAENFLITCGTCENSFQVISLTDGRMVQSVRQHRDVVSCISVTSDGSILATGSYDTTVMIWEIVRIRTPEKRVKHTQAEVPRKDCIIAETPFHILCGHDDIITCLYASIELDIVISGSKDGTCVFHTLRDGRYVRSLRHPSGSPLSKLVASRHGRIVFYSDDDLSLHLYSINGKHISSSESNGRLNCLELSSCGEFLVCAGDQGLIIVRSMNSLEIVGKYNGIGKMVTSLTVTPEECFIAGSKDGRLLVYSIENPQLRKTSFPRNSKSKASMT